jgi:hypothetical protein
LDAHRDARFELVNYLTGRYPRGWTVEGTRFVPLPEIVTGSASTPIVTWNQACRYLERKAKYHTTPTPPRVVWEFQPHHRSLSESQIKAAISAAYQEVLV